jgi:hypothetical protein
MICPKCGKESTKLLRCSYCGAILRERFGSESVNRRGKTQETGSRTGRRRLRNGPVLIPLALVAVVLMVFLYAKNNGSLPLTSAPAAEVSGPASPAANASADTAGLRMTREEILEYLNKSLSQNGHPTIRTDDKAVTSLPGRESLAYEWYGLIDGISVYCFIDTTADHLVQFVYYVDHSRLTPEDYDLPIYLSSVLPFLFEPDTYQALDRELGLSSIHSEEDYSSSASREDRDYYFIVTGDTSCLIVTPAGADIIPFGAGSPAPSD